MHTLEDMSDKRFRYVLTVHDDDTDEEVCLIEAYSQESLEEQLHKADTAITSYLAEELAMQYESDDDEFIKKEWV